MAMTNEHIVAIPDDVRDNVTQVTRVMDGRLITREGQRPVELTLRQYREHYREYGLTLHEFDTVDSAGHRITVTWFANIHQHLTWAYVTEYFTQVPCHCGYRWAVAYVAYDQDGIFLRSRPVCSIHLDSARLRVERARDAGVDLTLHVSEPLHTVRHRGTAE